MVSAVLQYWPSEALVILSESRTQHMVHGGPQSQYAAEFSFEAQLFAANGYTVIMPNPRGSTGRGTAYGNEQGQSGTGSGDAAFTMEGVRVRTELEHFSKHGHLAGTCCVVANHIERA